MQPPNTLDILNTLLQYYFFIIITSLYVLQGNLDINQIKINDILKNELFLSITKQIWSYEIGMKLSLQVWKYSARTWKEHKISKNINSPLRDVSNLCLPCLGGVTQYAILRRCKNQYRGMNIDRKIVLDFLYS